MGVTIDQIVEETREWPEEDVAELGDRIYRAKYEDIPVAVEAAWREEINRRIADLLVSMHVRLRQLQQLQV